MNSALSPDQIAKFADVKFSGNVSRELAYYICQMRTDLIGITTAGEPIQVGVSETGTTFFYTGDEENPVALPENQPLCTEDKAYLFDALIGISEPSSKLKAATAKIDDLENEIRVVNDRLTRTEAKAAKQHAGLNMMRDAFADLGVPARVAVHGFWNFARVLNGKEAVKFPKKESLEPEVADHWKKITTSHPSTRYAFSLYPSHQSQSLQKSPTRTPNPENQAVPNPLNLPTPTPTPTHLPSPSVQQKNGSTLETSIDLSQYDAATQSAIRKLQAQGVVLQTLQKPKQSPELAAANDAIDETEAKLKAQKARLQGLLKNIPLMAQGPPTPAVLGPALRDGTYHVAIDTSAKRTKILEVIVELASSERKLFKSSYASVANLLFARQTWDFDDLVQAIEDFKPKDQPGKVWAEYVWAIIGHLQKVPGEW